MRIECLILLLVAACGDQSPTGGGGEPEAPIADADLLPAEPSAQQVQAQVDRAMATIPGASSAQYRSVRAGAGGAACGEIATEKNLYRPFIVTPQGVALIAAGAAIAFEDPQDFVADAWIRWCATPEDLERLAPDLERAAASPIEEPVTANDLLPTVAPPPPLPPMPAPAPAPSQAERRTAPAAPAPEPRIDSFFNSVQR